MWRRRELLKNKIYSVLFILLGALSVLVEYDGTFFIFTLMFGIPMFFAKENWITEGDRHYESKESRRQSLQSSSPSTIVNMIQ